MWSGGDEYNDKGVAVRLYHPILYGRKPAQKDLLSSYVGGGDVAGEEEGKAVDHESVPRCALCHEKTQLLVQLCVPPRDVFSRRRTFRVFACNHAPCYLNLFQESPLCYGGGGVVLCERIMVNAKEQSTCPMTASPPEESSPEISAAWADEENHQAMNGDDNANQDDWGVGKDGGDKDDAMDDLESKLAAMESSTSEAPEKKSVSRKKESKPSSTRRNNFPCYELHSLQEPHARKPEGMDEDDVGFSAAGSDDKIQQMLARYMAEEEDEGILAALRGSMGASSGGGGGGRSGKERDERLSAEDRALLTYTDRLKRSPRQVVRYAYGGIPLWSIPVAPSNGQRQNSQQKKPRAEQQPIPPCSCGSPRVFEFQLLSSLLHVLQVDRFCAQGASLDTAFSSGSMNWGNLAVYTCSNEKCEATTQEPRVLEYVVLQDSAEGTPTPRRTVANMNKPMQFSMEPVVIAEGTDFGAADDDDDEEEEEEDDEEAEDLLDEDDGDSLEDEGMDGECH